MTNTSKDCGGPYKMDTNISFIYTKVLIYVGVGFEYKYDRAKSLAMYDVKLALENWLNSCSVLHLIACPVKLTKETVHRFKSGYN
jgi:hypothetical protein